MLGSPEGGLDWRDPQEEWEGLGGRAESSGGPPTINLCWILQVPAQAELLRDHPAQPLRGVPAPQDWGQLRTGSHSAEQSPGGFFLHPQSPRPRREEPVGADGCDMGELGLLEVGRKSSMSHGKQVLGLDSVSPPL